MSKVLKLYNSFSRSFNEVKLNGKTIGLENRLEPKYGSFYICGPTVYSDSHLGHAITYTRADLFRRFMKSIFGTRLITVMNITDIDDKILAKTSQNKDTGMPTHTKSLNSSTLPADPSRHPFTQVSELYLKSFLKDMQSIRVQPADITVKVTQQINLIVKYIQELERSKHAYLAENGDIYFSVKTVANYLGRTDPRREAETVDPDGAFKQDDRDFALWKAAKPNEPTWVYTSCLTGQEVRGRPGWHVQCSAISSAIFGNQLDFHFGGKDLIFPHHYNEQACCCAYHRLDTAKNFHVWTSNWLHSGHLVMSDEKMSKSLGNVVSIGNFIKSSSVNILRLACIDSHYRADVHFNEKLLDDLKLLDHRISAFTSYLGDELKRFSEISLFQVDEISLVSCESLIRQTQEEMLDGFCDDLDLNRGLQSLLNLSRHVYNIGPGRIRAQDLVSLWDLVTDWCHICGLEYGPISESYDENLVKLTIDFRQKVRSLTIDHMNKIGKLQSSSEQGEEFLKSILNHCDNTRARMNEFGYVIRDKKT